MNLVMPSQFGSSYSGPTQKARVITEGWMAQEGYCPACLSRLSQTAVNSRAIDFGCDDCGIPFQLKSMKSEIGMRVPDGAYETMLSAVRGDSSPALLLLRYDLSAWMVRDLIAIPSFALTEQAIIPRKPLAPHARRAGWVGCNIDLSKIPPDARVRIVEEGKAHPRQSVADKYARLKPLQLIGVKQRGWALAVLNGIQNLGRLEFTTREAYQMESMMAQTFPGNSNVRPKIRQQLQVLRDLGLVEHLERGQWRLPVESSLPANSKTNKTNES